MGKRLGLTLGAALLLLAGAIAFSQMETEQPKPPAPSTPPPSPPPTATTCQLHGTARRVGGEPVHAVVVWVEARLLPVRPPQEHELKETAQGFEPGVLPIQLGDSVRFLSGDRGDHTVFSRSPAHPFEVRPNDPKSTTLETFDLAGWVHLQCAEHPAHLAGIRVLRNPWYATVDAAGRFKLPPLPRGKYELHAAEPNGGEDVQTLDCVGSTGAELKVRAGSAGPDSNY